MRKIVLGITGSIAAYKGAELASSLTQAGNDVHVVMTRHAAEFIAPLTFETLTRNRVVIDMFMDEDNSQVTHIGLGTGSDLILIAPASYNIIGKAANGIADDLLSSIIAAAKPEKIMLAPAMNVNMYNNPACQANVATLLERGCQLVEPEEGMLACGVTAKGRLARIPAILEAVDAFFCPKTMNGQKVLITAGATREYFDPIRFISNSSSGQMGAALARACRNRGAQVTLLMANAQLNVEGVELIRVETVAELYQAALNHFPGSDWLFAAAAVTDFKPKVKSDSKIKKSGTGLCLELEANTDVLLALSRQKTGQRLVGFAAESDDLLINARAKLEKKGLDMIVANHLSNFAGPDGQAWLLTPEKMVELPRQPKGTLAEAIVDAALAAVRP